MRGDSLRDFYAKTFVVLGLGVLAAGGALVDYWPTNGELPTVSTVASLRRAAPALVQDLDREIPAPILRPAIREMRIANAAYVPPATAPAEVELSLPVPPLPEPIPANFILTSVAIDVPMFVLALGAAPMPEPAPAGPVAETGLGDRVTDVLKRTGEAIRDARSSLRGAFSGVLGAVRRANPFFNSNATSFR